MADIVYVALFAFFVLIAAVVGAVYVYLKTKEDPQPSAPLILNFMARENNGRFLGKEIKTEGGAHNRTLIDYRPLDIDTFKIPLKEIRDKIKPERIVTNPEKIISLAIGELSQDTAIKIILPDKIDEYPESLKNTILGKGLMWAVGEKNMEKTVKEIMEESTYSRDKLLKKINNGEITSEFIDTMESLFKDALRMVVRDEEKKHKSSLNPSSFGGLPGGATS